MNPSDLPSPLKNNMGQSIDVDSNYSGVVPGQLESLGKSSEGPSRNKGAETNYPSNIDLRALP